MLNIQKTITRVFNTRVTQHPTPAETPVPILLTEDIIIKSDSKLVVEQMNGNWKINDFDLMVLAQAADKLLKLLPNVKIERIPREQNLAGKLLE